MQTGQEALLGQRTAEDVANEWAEYLTAAQQKWLASRSRATRVAARGSATAPGAHGRACSRPSSSPTTISSPALILIALVMFVPLVVGLSYAFRDIRILNAVQPAAWSVSRISRPCCFGTGSSGARSATPCGGPAARSRSSSCLGLGLALLLNRQFGGRRLVQARRVPAVGGADLPLRPDLGLAVQPGDRPAAALARRPRHSRRALQHPGRSELAMWGPIVANVWFGIPFFAITLLAALQAIPRELYEAAAIDGANAWQRFTKVTLPFLAPMIAITVLLRTIWISNFADLVVVMTGGGPANATQILPSYIFTTAYRKLDFGYASAIATALLLLLLLYALILIRMRRALAEHDMSAPARLARQGSGSCPGPPPGDRALHAVRAVPAVLADQDLGDAGPAPVHRGHAAVALGDDLGELRVSSCCAAISRRSSPTR